MGEINDTARRLLQEMGYQAEGNTTLDVLPGEAAKNLDLVPSSPKYQAALNHLIALGDVERKVPADFPADLDLLGQNL